MKEIHLTCISCPVGCALTVRMDGDRIVGITGNRCPRGEAYARQEVTAPVRTVATSVKVDGGALPLVSVKTDRPIPKRLIPELMELVKSLSVPAPVRIGQVLAHDVLGTGVNLVATRTVDEVSLDTHPGATTTS